MLTSAASISASRPLSDSAPTAQSVRSDLSVYLDEVNRFSLLTADEERELGWKIVNEDCAVSREKLIRSNLRLVVFIAKKYLRRGLELTDLIEEGNVGLVQAANHFDPAHGARFSTYGSWWIKAAIRRALVKSTQQVHVPIYMVELTSKWKAAGRALETKLGEAPSTADFASVMNISPRMVGIVRDAAGILQKSSSFAHRADSDRGPHDLIADERTPQPHDRLFQSEQLARLEPLLQTLDSRDAEMLRLRFGIGGRPPLRLAEIADRFNVTGERVRQLIEHALTRLQSKLLEDTTESSVPTRFAPARSSDAPARTHPALDDAPSSISAAFLSTRLARRPTGASRAVADRA